LLLYLICCSPSGEYQYLKSNRGSRSQQLFFGRIRAEVLYRETVGREPLTPEMVARAAADASSVEQNSSDTPPTREQVRPQSQKTPRFCGFSAFSSAHRW
jgi:hypothetical protein